MLEMERHKPVYAKPDDQGATTPEVADRAEKEQRLVQINEEIVKLQRESDSINEEIVKLQREKLDLESRLHLKLPSEILLKTFLRRYFLNVDFFRDNWDTATVADLLKYRVRKYGPRSNWQWSLIDKESGEELEISRVGGVGRKALENLLKSLATYGFQLDIEDRIGLKS